MHLNNLTFILLLLSSLLSATAQEDPPEGTVHIKYTDAVKYENGDTSFYKRSYTYYDENWEVIENTATLAAVVNETHKKRVTEVQTDRLKIYADIDDKGDTTSKIIFKYDDQGNRTEYYQVLRGDTVVRQRRTYDQQGNNLTLINYEDACTTCVLETPSMRRMKR